MLVLAKNAVRTIVEESGLGSIAVSKAMGKSDSFVAMTISRGSVPKLDTFADIAKACGYELVLRGHDQEIVIDARSDGEPSDLA